MRAVHLGPVPRDAGAKLDWCVRAIQQIASASQAADPNQAADAFTLDNVTASRSLDADTATTAQLADVVGTFLQDLKRRGGKGAGV